MSADNWHILRVRRFFKRRSETYAPSTSLRVREMFKQMQGTLPLTWGTGNGESLRDEIVYLAHRCAAPEKYQPRAGVMKGNKRQLENAQKWTTPTKVGLLSLRRRMALTRVGISGSSSSLRRYSRDSCSPPGQCTHTLADMCHVLTVFLYTDAVRIQVLLAKRI
jgi:hypothetical protein